MNKMNLYIIQDTIACGSGPVFEAVNDGIAKRMYDKMMENNKYKNEFRLYCVGSIDHETNKIKTFNAREVIVTLDTKESVSLNKLSKKLKKLKEKEEDE